jgi:ADP-heptose:LPS heptosyltransferase
MDWGEYVEERAGDYRSKLELIDRAIMEEMDKVGHQRRLSLLIFLYKEKEAYSQAFVELESLSHLAGEEQKNGSSASGSERSINGVAAPKTREENGPLARRTYRIVTWGGIGDGLLITPAIRALKQRDPDCRIHVYCKSRLHREVMRDNKHIDRLLTIGAWGAVIFNLIAPLKLVETQVVDYGRLAPSLFYRRHAAEIIGEMLEIKIDDLRPECFLTAKEEEEARRIVAAHPSPIAIQATAGSTPNKNWPAEKWEELIDRNPQYTFLQLGAKDDEFIRGAVDLRGMPLRVTFGIVKEALAFVGVDSVFAHVAAAFRKPAVVLFGASTPTIWGHATSINLYRPPRCSPCIDILARDPCPYGRTCMSNIAVSDVERALSSLIPHPVSRSKSLH